MDRESGTSHTVACRGVGGEGKGSTRANPQGRWGLKPRRWDDRRSKPPWHVYSSVTNLHVLHKYPIA